MKITAPTFLVPGKGTAARFYQGDCCQIMPRLPQGKVDLVFADPPFNIGEDYGEDGGASDRMAWPDYLAFTGTWLSLCARLLRPGGSMFVHCPDSIAGHVRVHMQETL